MERVYCVQDQDGHWYVIPYEMREQFFELDEKMGTENEVEFHESDDEFSRLFSHYRTGGDLNLVELYAKI